MLLDQLAQVVVQLLIVLGFDNVLDYGFVKVAMRRWHLLNLLTIVAHFQFQLLVFWGTLFV